MYTAVKLGVNSCINKEISSDAAVAIRLGNDPGTSLPTHVRMFCRCTLQVLWRSVVSKTLSNFQRRRNIAQTANSFERPNRIMSL